jgi:multidrug transporter EmrE-like cation transporter
MNKLLAGVLFGIMGQVTSFLQLQGSIKYGWFEKYPLLVLLSAIPSTWFYIKSVENLVGWGDGALWPSRLIGFGIGIIIFVTLSMVLFKEPLTLKTLSCLLLAALILTIQIFWK